VFLLVAALTIGILAPTALAQVFEGSPASNNTAVTLTNAQRTRQGSPAVTVDPVLTALAQIRAIEIAENYSNDRRVITQHLRADGSAVLPWLVREARDRGLEITASAENLTRGRTETWRGNELYSSSPITASDAVTAWMNSPGHRQALLDSRYNLIGIAHAYRDGNHYWVQFLATGPVRQGAAATAGTQGTQVAVPLPAAVPPAATITPSNATAMAQQAVAAAAAGTVPTVRLTNPAFVQHASMQAIATAAGGNAIRVNADTMMTTATGTAVDVRITLNPALVTGDLNLAASTTTAEPLRIANFFRTHFVGDFTVVHMQQRETFGQTVRIAARLAPNQSRENFVFYTFNREANTFRLITPENVTVCSAGYVHFSTALAGDILISDRVLVRR